MQNLIMRRANDTRTNIRTKHAYDYTRTHSQFLYTLIREQTLYRRFCE